jgi:hypothetical protein
MIKIIILKSSILPTNKKTYHWAKLYVEFAPYFSHGPINNAVYIFFMFYPVFEMMINPTIIPNVLAKISLILKQPLPFL